MAFVRELGKRVIVFKQLHIFAHFLICTFAKHLHICTFFNLRISQASAHLTTRVWFPFYRSSELLSLRKPKNLSSAFQHPLCQRIYGQV